jgi:hypothetical protein
LIVSYYFLKEFKDKEKVLSVQSRGFGMNVQFNTRQLATVY